MPFLTFSDDSGAARLLTNNMTVEPKDYDEDSSAKSLPNRTNGRGNLTHFWENQTNSPSLKTSTIDDSTQPTKLKQEADTLTYTDSLLLNAENFRKIVKTAWKKRKAQNTVQADQRPQKQYTVVKEGVSFWLAS